ncbi:MAG: helix-turn-helix domain-containing protein [Oscillospiraceae bacterium]|nr:helix-turn-helix domain-containing protein [Oscillospiraceae bacterium]
MSIGEKLKSLRFVMQRTQKQQSEVFGVALITVYRWEHDLTIPKLSVLKQIADYYNVTCEWLLDESDEDEQPEPADKPNYTDGIEHQLLKMFRQLPVDKKNKVLGYIERIFVECAAPNS